MEKEKQNKQNKKKQTKKNKTCVLYARVTFHPHFFIFIFIFIFIIFSLFFSFSATIRAGIDPSISYLAIHARVGSCGDCPWLQSPVESGRDHVPRTSPRASLGSFRINNRHCSIAWSHIHATISLIQCLLRCFDPLPLPPLSPFSFSFSFSFFFSSFVSSSELFVFAQIRK